MDTRAHKLSVSTNRRWCGMNIFSMLVYVFTVFVHILTVYVYVHILQCFHPDLLPTILCADPDTPASVRRMNEFSDTSDCFYSVSLCVICLQSCVHPLIVFRRNGGPNDTPETSWPVGRESIPTPAANTVECSLCVFTFSLSLPPLSSLPPPSQSNSSHFHTTLSLWLLCEPWGKLSLPRFTLLLFFHALAGTRCCFYQTWGVAQHAHNLHLCI